MGKSSRRQRVKWPGPNEHSAEWDAEDAEEVAPRDLLHDPTYLRELLRWTWEILPEDVNDDTFPNAESAEEVEELAARVAAILAEEKVRGYVADDGPEEEEEEEEEEDEDEEEEEDDDEEDEAEEAPKARRRKAKG